MNIHILTNIYIPIPIFVVVIIYFVLNYLAYHFCYLNKELENPPAPWWGELFFLFLFICFYIGYGACIYEEMPPDKFENIRNRRGFLGAAERAVFYTMFPDKYWDAWDDWI